METSLPSTDLITPPTWSEIGGSDYIACSGLGFLDAALTAISIGLSG